MTRPSTTEGPITTISDPEQVWHLARLATAREAIAVFPSIDPDTVPPTVLSAVSAYLDQLDRCAHDAWADYVRLVAFSVAERDAYMAMGEPEHIRLNQEEGTPVAHWNANNPSLAGVFGELLVEDEGAPSFHVSDPFRPMDLSALPPSALKIALRDSRHTAIAAMHELVTLIYNDFKGIVRMHGAQESWPVVRRHCQFLKSSARISLSFLQHDHYQQWDPTLEPFAGLQQAPLQIDQKAATTTAQQRLALHYASHGYGAVLEKAEVKSGRTGVDRIEAAHDLLRSGLADLGRALDAMNATILGVGGIDPAGVAAMVVFRPVSMGEPTLTPMFVAIPREELSPPTPITR